MTLLNSRLQTDTGRKSYWLSPDCTYLQVRKEQNRTNPSWMPEERDIRVRPAHTRKRSNSNQTWSQLPQLCRQRQRFDETQTRRRCMMGWGGWRGEGERRRSGGLLTEWELPFKRERVTEREIERFKPTSDSPVGGILKNFPGSHRVRQHPETPSSPPPYPSSPPSHLHPQSLRQPLPCGHHRSLRLPWI